MPVVYCTRNWSPIVSVAQLAPIAGVLAGFVLVAVIGLLVVPAGAARPGERARATRVLMVAMLELVVASFLLSLLAGDQVCARAASGEVLAAGLLATSVVLVLVAMSWLAVAFDRAGDGVLGTVWLLLGFGLAMVLLLSWVSATDYVAAVRPGTGHWGSDIGLGAGVVVAGLVLALLFRARLAAGPGDGGDPVRALVGMSLVAAAVAASVVGGQMLLKLGSWTPQPAHALVQAEAWLGMLVPFAVLICAVRAVATRPA